MQKDKYNRNGRPLNHVLKYEEIFSEDFYISYFFSCHAQPCVYGDELRIVLLHHTPISSCPHHSTCQCSSFLFFNCEISICSLFVSPSHLFMTTAQASCHPGIANGPAPESGGQKWKWLSLVPKRLKHIYLILSYQLMVNRGKLPPSNFLWDFSNSFINLKATSCHLLF